MRLLRLTMIGALTLLTTGAAPADDRDELVLDADAPYINVTIRGHPLKLRVEFDAPTPGITLNRNVAKLAHLDAMFRRSTSNRCFPEKLDILLDIGPLPPPDAPLDPYGFGYPVGFETSGRTTWWKQLLQWGENRNIADDADGIISPEWVPNKRVTLRFHAPVAGERTFELRMKPFDLGQGHIPHSVKVENKWMRISYAPHHPYNLATTAAGAHLAATRGGYWTGEPQTIKLRWGFERPVRHITLRRGLSLGGVPLRGFLVDKTALKGSKLPPDDPEPDADAKPDEIVVKGRKIFTRPENCGSWELILGREALEGCSSITHDKKNHKLIFQCLWPN